MTSTHVDPWVQTVTGVAFDLLAPRVEDVNVADIAVSLARLNRYTGHTLEGYELRGYSVAQHSVHVSQIVETWGAPKAVVREALLHDASEAYYGDVASPVQRAMREVYRSMLGELAAEILIAWGDATAEAAAARVLDFAERSDPFRELKRLIDPVVRVALELPAEEHALVKRADLVALACERRSLMAPCERDWNLPEFADVRWLSFNVLPPDRARAVFLERLVEMGHP